MKKKMEDRLVAVCGHPVLYDTTSPDYKNRMKKDQAWRTVSEEIGVSEDACRKRWKGLRDTYLRERKKVAERRSGSAAGSNKKWKYSTVLSFLDPFLNPRETTSNMGRGVEEDGTVEYSQTFAEPDEEEDEADAEAEASPAGPSGMMTGGLFTSEDRTYSNTTKEEIINFGITSSCIKRSLQ